jgi:hypothetical protein
MDHSHETTHFHFNGSTTGYQRDLGDSGTVLVDWNSSTNTSGSSYFVALMRYTNEVWRNGPAIMKDAVAAAFTLVQTNKAIGLMPGYVLNVFNHNDGMVAGWAVASPSASGFDNGNYAFLMADRNNGLFRVPGWRAGKYIPSQSGWVDALTVDCKTGYTTNGSNTTINGTLYLNSSGGDSGYIIASPATGSPGTFSIHMREANQSVINYRSFGGAYSLARGHAFYGNGLLGAQTEVFRISDDASGTIPGVHFLGSGNGTVVISNNSTVTNLNIRPAGQAAGSGLTIGPGGNIGINTNGPNAELVVRKSSAGTGISQFRVTTSADSSMLELSDTGNLRVFNTLSVGNSFNDVAMNYNGVGEIVSRSTGFIGFSPSTALVAKDTALYRASAGVVGVTNIGYPVNTVAGAGNGGTNYTLLADQGVMYLGSSNVNILASMRGAVGTVVRWTAIITNLSAINWGYRFDSATNNWSFVSAFGQTNVPNGVLSNDMALRLEGEQNGTNVYVRYSFMRPLKNL